MLFLGIKSPESSEFLQKFSQPYGLLANAFKGNRLALLQLFMSADERPKRGCIRCENFVLYLAPSGDPPIEHIQNRLLPSRNRRAADVDPRRD